MPQPEMCGNGGVVIDALTCTCVFTNLSHTTASTKIGYAIEPFDSTMNGAGGSRAMWLLSSLVLESAELGEASSDALTSGLSMSYSLELSPAKRQYLCAGSGSSSFTLVSECTGYPVIGSESDCSTDEDSSGVEEDADELRLNGSVPELLEIPTLLPPNVVLPPRPALWRCSRISANCTSMRRWRKRSTVARNGPCRNEQNSVIALEELIDDDDDDDEDDDAAVVVLESWLREMARSYATLSMNDVGNVTTSNSCSSSPTRTTRGGQARERASSQDRIKS